ncbi:hypothetical protein Pmani_034417 [Petrolisthes manimaculis]|uniref:Peptidase S9 prolyl oligopeptidase catalytic domain-containing protein n=1 Tax=Petrolisthes manimaculis TaxID=1843537 RepID=A0AAE1NMI6_9EUCA|nr:hypothetical protein Pmani_034417 [Petrolisthes manimaculis]
MGGWFDVVMGGWFGVVMGGWFDVVMGGWFDVVKGGWFDVVMGGWFDVVKGGWFDVVMGGWFDVVMGGWFGVVKGGWFGVVMGGWFGVVMGGWFGVVMGGWFDVVMGGWFDVVKGGWFGVVMGGWFGVVMGGWFDVVKGGWCDVVMGGWFGVVRLSLPPEFSEEEAFIRPVVVQVGGHPGEHTLNHKWKVDWSTYLASNRSWVVVEAAVRGGAGQDLGLVYKPGWKLGQLEAHDHIQVTRSLLEQLEFLDGARVAVVGWGHGGHNAARITTQDTSDPPTFVCTALINPITDWSLYASYYSEKYMGTAKVVPGGNYRGYEESSLLLQAGTFKNRSLLLVHGSADTDVHPDHTLKFSRALTKSGVIFRQQTYTDEGHDLDRVEMHLYRTLEQYISSSFPPYTEEELSLLFGKGPLP